ncbi:MAG TPA: hypothetical protein VKY73_19325, partial [Polyangiaceae bacterium]|nr:hypothetical protein [Polyangiaceae bacterium]
RVGIWDLERNETVLRLRTEASGELVRVGAQPVRDPENVAAQRRQANSCALALEVRNALEQRSEAAAGPDQGGGVAPSAKQ